MKLTPLAVEIFSNGHIFILAAPSKEAFITSFNKHSEVLATQLASGSTSTEESFIRCRQAVFIGGVYQELTK